MLKYSWEASDRPWPDPRKLPHWVNNKKLTFDVYGNQKNHWNVKQQDGVEELTDFNTIHGLQRFISIYPTRNSKNRYH